MKSMTGYGEGTAQVLGARITVQLRTLNHRHLDLQLRTPREFLAFEEEIRKSLRQRIARGRIEVFIGRAALRDAPRRLVLNEPLLAEYVRLLRSAKKKFGLAGDMDVSLLPNFSDLFQVTEAEPSARAERQALFKALRGALVKLERSRAREGRQLKTDIVSHLKQLRKIAAMLQNEGARVGVRHERAASPGGEPAAQAKTLEGNTDTDSWVLKGDINEEVVRLHSHLAALAEVVDERDAIGKKIDFMLQEVHRELNTIGSKVPDLAVTRLVLAGKERVEKIREQAQNIE